MAESIVQVTEGSGKKLHTNSYTVGANTVEDEVVIPGPNPYGTYFLSPLGSISIAVANDHVLCLNGSASVKTRIHRIRLEQANNATTAAFVTFEIWRTTTATPTGGTAVTPAPLETGDTAAAVGRTLPTAKGTEGTMLMRFTMSFRQAVSATSAQMDDVWEWTEATHGKPIIIPTGATNGIVIKSLTATASATVHPMFEFTETAF